MSTTSTFNPATGILNVIGDTADNSIVTSRDAAGRILVNGVNTIGGTPTVANTSLIQIFGQGGNDTITVNEANGALPAVQIFGGNGNDRITGGSGNDLQFGQADNDTINGGGGNDLLFGGDGNDTLDGGTGTDQLFGGAGNDTMIWNPGGGTDLFEGGDGTDTALVNGGNGAETFTITANGTRVRFDRVSPAPFSIDIGTTENLVLHAGGGDDVITAGNGLASLISLTLDGGDGNDTITGGDGNDLLIGGNGNDTIIGGRGADNAQLGAGDDTFIWNPGDGSDTVDGGSGTDKLLFNGANVNEKIDITANGNHSRFTRDVANIVMDLNSIEQIEFNALGGADNITVGDLTGTSVKQVTVHLEGAIGGTQGDGAADTITLNATGKNDHITVTGSGTTVNVTGLPEAVTITGAEGANDRLIINGLGGNDTIDASALAAGVIGLTIDGGAGNDTITGSQGNDMLIGGDGNDTVNGGRGNDVANLGAGDDTFVWNPGDGSDTVIGGDGKDTLVFNGAHVNETFQISANGADAVLARDVGNVLMDLNGVERIELATLGGSDTVIVNDLTGTGVTQVAIDLSGTIGGKTGDGAADSVTVNGTNGDDRVSVVNSGGSIVVNGLAAQVTIAHADAGDSLTVNGGLGNDTIDASAIKAGQLASLTINGGAGNDTITGSAGNDVIIGGQGNDVASMGAGDDTFIWNPGDGSDTVEGGSGTDTMLFNGANVAEKIDISANGNHARFTRDVANIVMDTHSVEKIQFNALGGADNITVNDMTGTNVSEVDLNLGGNDGAADTVTINATNGDDVITVSQDANGNIIVSGLATEVKISGFEAANDRLIIKGLGGDDVITASGLPAGSIQLTADGGDGNDVLIGGNGNDTLLGGAGDDILIGGPGQDVLDGGTGSNVLFQDGGAGAGLAHAVLLRQAMASSFVTDAGHAAVLPPDPTAAQQPALAPPHA
jgi:Ca2+-binding RTX toxin-like protein